MTPLAALKKGTKAKIVQLNAGRGLMMQIKHMGLREGDTIQVIQNSQGPVIIAKGSLRLALGRGMSHKILVEENKEISYE